MSFARFLVAASMAVAVTLGLLLLMHVLIQSDMTGPAEVKEYSIPDIVMPARELVTERDITKPVREDDPDDLPPELPEPDFENPTASNDGINVRPAFDNAGGGFDGGLNIGGDGEMIPLTVIQPEYPRRAAQRGQQGYCTVEFTVSSMGTTKDIFVADCPDRIFERSSLRAAQNIRYKPRVVDGEPVDVVGVQYRFLFQMEE